MRLMALLVALGGFWAGSARADDIRVAQPSTVSAPETLLGIDARGLTEQIEQALIQDTGFNELRSFAVLWDQPTFLCLVKTSEIHETQFGACLVETVAFQVAATALIVRTDKKETFEVSILEAMIE